jgi:regulator of RNase E activity RraA
MERANVHPGKEKKLGGIVLDTGVRNSSKMKEVVFFVFSRSVLPMETLKDAPGSIDIPVQCGGDIANFKDCHLSRKARWMSRR